MSDFDNSAGFLADQENQENTKFQKNRKNTRKPGKQTVAMKKEKTGPGKNKICKIANLNYVKTWNKKVSTFQIFSLRRAHIMCFNKGNVRSWDEKVSTFKIFRLRRAYIMCFNKRKCQILE